MRKFASPAVPAWVGLCVLVAGCSASEEPPAGMCAELGESCLGVACCAGTACDAVSLSCEEITDAGAPGPGSGCSETGESCSGGKPCCAGLSCIAGRVCGSVGDGGAATSDGGASGDAGAAVGSDAGAGSGDGGATSDGGAPDASAGVCAEERADCSTMPCCAGLSCTATDLGLECRS